jgi:hypothetical protein
MSNNVVPIQPQSPPGTRQIVIFDTNAYRELTFGLSLNDARNKSFQLRQLEVNSGHFALANPVVIWELVAHLADPTDPAYANCLSGMVALAEHT